jgi:hypothetical protein
MSRGPMARRYWAGHGLGPMRKGSPSNRMAVGADWLGAGNRRYRALGGRSLTVGGADVIKDVPSNEVGP